MIDIKTLRKEKKITQIELSEILGIDQAFISQIENGAKNLPADRAKILKKKFGDLSAYITKPTKRKKTEILPSPDLQTMAGLQKSIENLTIAINNLAEKITKKN